MNLALDLGEPTALWRHVPVEYSPARELADRHYSRQTVGADGILPPGERFLFWHQSEAGGRAVWGVVRNRFRGQWRWRNSLYRNESTVRSSDLIRDATRLTFELWERRYKAIPPEPLTTEIDIEATAKRRSKHHQAGHCYLMAGWEPIGIIEPGHGRPARVVFRAPMP